MKKETVLILFVVILIAGVGIGLIISAAMKPAAQSTSGMQQAGAPAPLSVPEPSAGDYGAEQLAANKARLTDAIKNLKLALEKDPNDLEVLVELGNDYFDIGQFYSAIEMYQRALVINPNMPDVIVDMGIMYREVGKPNEAIAQFTRAANIAPTHLNARLNRAIVYKMDLKDYPNAIEDFNKALTLIPTNDPQAAMKIEQIKGEIASIKEEMEKKK